MKTLLALFLCLTTFISQADFLDASKNYNEGQFKQAFDEMIVLAKFGHQLSQQNVAIMLFKGEGTDKDIIQSYAWSQLLNNEKISKQLTPIIVKLLSQDQLQTAKKLALDYKQKYASENSKVLLGPIVDEKTTQDENGHTITGSGTRIINNKFYAPTYPLKLLQRGIEGWVDLTFNIYPDGSVRDIQVTKEVPPNTFAAEAIKSAELSKYTFEKNGVKSSIIEPRSYTQRVQFKIRNSPTEFSKKQRTFINDLINKANHGDIDAQFTYASIYDTYLQRKGDIGPEQINQWLFNAAQSGIHDAQYRLGKNIYYGQDCKVEKQKGMDWIMRAAQEGNANAEFMAYQMLKNNTVVNQSSQSPFYWLEQSANNGLAVAQLNYANEIALLEHPTEKQKSLATEYLKSYSRKMHKTIQWHQVNALLRLKTDKKPKKALASINKAIKKAKAIGWDVTELNAQKQLILASKNQ